MACGIPGGNLTRATTPIPPIALTGLRSSTQKAFVECKHYGRFKEIFLITLILPIVPTH